jgi:DNA sulfur modification protein DndE
MKPPTETLRISQRGKEILIRLKRKTGIEHWNVLCRWALAESLAKPMAPSKAPADQDSGVEIKWQTFGGVYSDIYTLMVHAHAVREFGSVANVNLAEYVRAHLERGLLSIQNRRDLEQLVAEPIALRIRSKS